VPPRPPRFLKLPGWREPLDLLLASRDRRRAALLFSGGGPGESARFSLFAADPYLTFRSRGGESRLEDPEGRAAISRGDPFAALASALARHPSLALPPWPFAGGGIGFFSYDAARLLEELPILALDDRPHADIDFALYGWAIAWDHERREWGVLATGAPWRDEDEQVVRAGSACREAARWAVEARPAAKAAVGRGRRPSGGTWRASLEREGYLDAVRSIQAKIADGHCYEVNLSRRLTVPDPIDGRDLFAALCRLNPAPFAAYIESSDGAVISSSPERFLRVTGRLAESRPIKGTAPRMADPGEDAAASESLLASDKDRAENVMIVDLVRNDLGRVCATGSIAVPSLCALESYAGVHHLVSTIRGELLDGRTSMDAIRALFPPGSMTGAPKISAMKVIESTEPVRRGPYAGVAGYLSSNGDVDLSVLIRTFVLSEGFLDLQTGGAVVADSDPSAEYEEMTVKGERALAALREVLESAGRFAGSGEDGAGSG